MVILILKHSKTFRKLDNSIVYIFNDIRVSNDLERAKKRMRRLTMEEKRAKKKEEELSERKK